MATDRQAAASGRAHKERPWPLLAGFLCAHALLLAWAAAVHSPTFDETGYLPAGIYHWRFGRFDLCRVNPPLGRMIAALPLLATQAKTDWRHVDSSSKGGFFAVGRDFTTANGGGTFFLYTLGRWACIPISLLGALATWKWSRDLFGSPRCWLALILWCFSPFIVGHGHLITPDVPAAAFGVCAGYAFWRWLHAPTWQWTLAAGSALGAAQLAKTTWVILFLLWPLMWASVEWRRRKPGRGLLDQGVAVSRRRQCSQLCCILLLGLYGINLGHGFEEVLLPLDQYQFRSKALGGAQGSNRFAAGLVGKVPIPLPANYLHGIDVVRAELEHPRPSFLRGEWRNGGWWYYYLYGLAVKVPLGTWLLVVLACVWRFCGWPLRGWVDDMSIMTPAVVVMLVVSSQTAFNHHVRYVMPALPFLFVWTSQAGCWITSRKRVAALLTCCSLTWGVVSSLFCFPHSLAYFNELVGGPSNGASHLVDSNVDWGQDLLFLKRWLDDHREVEDLKPPL